MACAPKQIPLLKSFLYSFQRSFRSVGGALGPLEGRGPHRVETKRHSAHGRRRSPRCLTFHREETCQRRVRWHRGGDPPEVGCNVAPPILREPSDARQGDSSPASLGHGRPAHGGNSCKIIKFTQISSLRGIAMT